MNTLLILAIVIAVVFAAYVVLLYTGKLIDKDGDFIPDVVEDAVEEVKERVDRVKEEITDVKKAVKEVANQAGDVVEAAKGKKRRGRPKKK